MEVCPTYIVWGSGEARWLRIREAGNADPEHFELARRHGFDPSKGEGWCVLLTATPSEIDAHTRFDPAVRGYDEAQPTGDER